MIASVQQDKKVQAPQGKTKPRAAVVGGGISGMTAALQLMKAGYDVDIYEGSHRAGGKIHTVSMKDGKGLSDHGGEFIDSDQKHIIELAKELKVPLIEANETTNTRYRMPNGTILTDETFMAAYRPISRLVYEDKLAMAKDPTGVRARHLDSMSVNDYLKELNARIPDNRTWMQRFWKKKPSVSSDVIKMAAQAYAAESMRPASQLSALQFMHETACESGDLIPSDCKYRVDGGTERLTKALEKELIRRKANFHFDSRVTGLSKEDGKFTLDVGDQPTEPYDKVVMGVQPHQLASIKGMDKFLPPEELQALQNLQGTAGSKLTVRSRVPVKNDGFFISSMGYEVWKRAPGEVVFMVGDDLSQKYKPDDLKKAIMDDYAKAHNSTATAMFDTKNVDFHGPDANNVCYWSAAQGQYLALRETAQSIDIVAQREGLGFVGAYLPGEIQMEDGADSANCMGHGVESAYRAVHCMTGHEKAREQALAQAQEVDMSMPEGSGGFVPPSGGQSPKGGSGRRTTSTRL